MRNRYWLPLVLLGFLVLGGVALRGDPYPYRVGFHGLEMSRAYESQLVLDFDGGQIDPYWIIGVVVILLITVIWQGPSAVRAALAALLAGVFLALVPVASVTWLVVTAAVLLVSGIAELALRKSPY